jgi:NAD(P)-dependent dehydrogenase (short-subunit alcohol dehydrogenase family)
MGRGLAQQLVADGCHVAFCDLHAETMAETKRLCQLDNPQAVRITTHLCDVSVEAQVERFRDEVVDQHATDQIHLLFNNAGIGGGGSFVSDSRSEWDRTFGVCWNGVYFNCRAFLPLLIASDHGHIINTSSVNGFWATLGTGVPHTAYCAAKFAVKGFSEALITDLRIHAPHVHVSVVMPGHIGTEIAVNSGRVLGRSPALEMDATEVAQARVRFRNMGMPVAEMSDDEIRAAAHQRGIDFREKAPMDGDQAAALILQGVQDGRWRILVGEDAVALDGLVRGNPEAAYEADFLEALSQEGHLETVTRARSPNE